MAAWQHEVRQRCGPYGLSDADSLAWEQGGGAVLGWWGGEAQADYDTSTITRSYSKQQAEADGGCQPAWLWWCSAQRARRGGMQGMGMAP